MLAVSVVATRVLERRTVVPSIGHIAVGLAAARARGGRWRVGRAVAYGLLSLLPDVDVFGFRFGIPYGSPMGHRGATHSLVAAAIVGLGAGVCAALRDSRGPRGAFEFVWIFAIVASHGLLDTLTDGGRGVALLWPLSYRRYFAPWRPIPVAPIGLGMLSTRGLHVAALEALIFLPLWIYAFFPTRR
jgi:inner membrane protein